MIAKKNSGHDLERKRSVFFQVGMLTAASFTLAAFTYTKELPGVNNERIFTSENQTTIVDFVPQPEKRVAQNQPQTPQTQHNDPLPTDPTQVGNPDLQDARAVDNSDNPDLKVIGAPTGGLPPIIVNIDEDPLDPYPPTPAEYIGGAPAIQDFINDQIRYPEIDRVQSVQGTVYVSFVIERNGGVSNVKVERGVSETIDREAIRVVKLLNQWIPAENAFGKVRTTAFLPIKFHLEN